MPCPTYTTKLSERSVHNFLSYLANSQTDKQTKTDKNITSLAEVINREMGNFQLLQKPRIY